jgi:hypothetical protein
MKEIDWSKAPEGATHFWHGNGHFYTELHGKFYLADRINHGSVNSPLSWIAQLVARPSPAWSGEGLPPVGTVCEYQRVRDWVKVEVFAIKPNENGSYTVLFTYESGAWAGCASPFSFRPIRTPEQIAAEEREAAIGDMALLIHQESHCASEPLSMAAAKSIASTLAMDGYRKVEQPK